MDSHIIHVLRHSPPSVLNYICDAAEAELLGCVFPNCEDVAFDPKIGCADFRRYACAFEAADYESSVQSHYFYKVQDAAPLSVKIA